LGRRILLTGATRGLGRALVDRFAERGHAVLGCGTSAEGIAALRAAHGPGHGSGHDFRAVDVADAGAVARWAEDLLAAGGPPDLVLNNAGVIHRSAPLWELSSDELERVLAVNVAGTANVIRAFLPALIAAGRGVVLNVSSGWGRSTSPLVAGYCASKHAIEGLSAALAQEVPRGITVCAVNPGIVDTAMLRSAWGAEAGAYPSAEEWSHGAADFLLAIGPRDHGRPLTIPG
jgi:NAD(P)-dependent dehydrogenase (short-subunit alcohol dehydrogenase family)